MPVSSGTNARVIVYNTVVNWLGSRVRIPPSQIRVERTFAGAPPDGYGQNTGSYMTSATTSAGRCRQSPDEEWFSPAVGASLTRATKLPTSLTPSPSCSWPPA
jgi:hypothetical protein